MNDLLKATTTFLVRFGYLSDAAGIESFTDGRLRQALASYQAFDANVARLKEQMAHIRDDGKSEALVPDGVMGPATALAMQLPRCDCPDTVELPSLGVGNWKGCHGADNHHKAIVRVDERNLPSFLRPHFVEVLKRVRNAYAKLGLEFVFRRSTDGQDYLGSDNGTGNANIEFSFTRGDGWIGLAIVGHNQRCSDNIWCRYEYRYQPSNIVREWTTLIKHELGHNCGYGHSRGGVMNPSLVTGLASDWSPNDPTYPLLVRDFSGEPVDVGGPDGPDPPDNPDVPGIGEPLGEAFRLYDGTVAQLRRTFSSGA